MILLRRGIKRLSALLCAALLLFHLGAYPLRARAAAAGALAAVAGVTVLGAYLMASGMYPYMTEAGQSLSEWTSDNLQPLLDRYNNYLSSIGKSYQITLQGATPTVKGYLTQGVIMMANDVWGKLREFVTWLQSEYNLADNQMGVRLGSVSSALPDIPYYSTRPTNSQLASSGLYLGTSYRIVDINNPNLDVVERRYYIGKSDSRVFGACAFRDNNKTMLYFYYGLPFTESEYRNAPNYPAVLYVHQPSGTDSSPDTVSKHQMTYNGQTYYYGMSSVLPGYYYGRENAIANNASYYVSDVVTPIYDSSDDVLMIGLGLLQGNEAFSGVTADTTTVAPLEALPDGMEWGGLAVEGTGSAASPAVVTDIIGGAIAEREKPVVTPVTIDIEVGTDVDTETGEITGDGTVIITPADIPLVSTDYQIPGLSSVFPFSLPWDIYRVYSALNAAPVRPEWDVTIYVPILEIQAPMHIGFPEDVAPAVDNFMLLARKLILVLLCVLTLIGVRNLIR